MKKALSYLLVFSMLALALAGCGGAPSTPAPDPGPGSSQDSNAPEAPKPLKMAYITQKLGDNAANDDAHSGIQKYMQENGVEITVVETNETQDNEINARSFAQEGYDLIMCNDSTASELLYGVARDYPETRFIIGEGVTEELDNITNLRTRVAEAGFLTGAFNVLMNQELGGAAKAAFIGGVRNPNLERAQYAFTAGAEYVGGAATAVYVGNFTDVAKGKEIAMQLHQDGLYLMQAFAGAPNMGVFQAAETMGDGYYSLGAASGQFHLSDKIVASLVKNMGVLWYNAINDYVAGKLPSGSPEFGLVDGAVGIKYNPKNEALVPQSIKDKITELEGKILSGEIVPPYTEAEYNKFAAEVLKK